MSLFQEFTTEESVTAVFLGLLGRPPKQGALDHYSAAIDDPGNGYGIAEMLSELVNSQPEWEERTDSMTRAQLVEYLFNNLFDRDPHFDEEGKNYWVDGEGASVPADQMVTQLIESAGAQDQIALANKVDAALSDPGTDFTLTNKADNLSGTDLDDVFDAPLVQNDLGGVTNSLASGDQVHAGAGVDELFATLVPETTAIGAPSDVIQPITTSLENAYFTMQTGSAGLAEPTLLEDLFGSFLGFFGEDGEDFATEVYYEDPAFLKDLSNIHIDAQKMNGIEQLWSDQSRADLYIEDVRSRPQDVTIGMRGTDPRVSYFVDFDSDVIAGDLGDSAVTYEFANLLVPSDELLIADSPEAGGWVESLEFTLDGETFILNGADIAAATTFAELEAAVEASLIAQGLVDLEVSLDTTFLNPVNGEPGAALTIFDPDGGLFTNPQTNVNDGATTGALFFDAGVGAPSEQDVETNIILDNVGRNDQGGILDVGGMSNQGIQIFNVEVDAKSWVAAMGSTSRIVNPETDSFRHLEEVYVEHVAGGAMGDLVIGSQANPANTDDNPTSLPTGGRVNPDGLFDVRVFDAASFDGAINLGASFSSEIFGRYLDDAEEPVQFQYLGGDAGNLFTLQFLGGSGSPGLDPFFNLDVVGGSADDRFNILGTYSWSNVSVDGGLGFDTLEVGSDIANPAGFNSIEKLVLAGPNDVNADMAALPGVEEVWIATGSSFTSIGYDSTISNLAADTTLIISGKNQTLGNANSNDDQDFGVITLQNAQAESQLIELDNTARLDGELYVDGLNVNGGNVNEIVLNSSGNRNTFNTVWNINAAGVTSLIAMGTQALNAEIDTFASGGQAFDVTAEDLGGAFFLDIEQDLITASNANSNEVTLTGSAATTDYLVLDGGGVADITSDTTVTGFETVEFDNFAGSVDVINFSGVGLYYVSDLDGVTTITNLKNGANVNIGDQDGDDFDLTLEGTGSGAINITLLNDDGGALNWDTNDLNVSGFNTVNLALGNAAGSPETTNLFLILDNADASAVPVAGDAAYTGDAAFFADEIYLVDNIVKNLVITGGNAGDGDSLTLMEDMVASLSTIDASGFVGTFTTILANAVIEDPNNPGDFISANTDTRFVLSGSTFADITLTPWDDLAADPQASGVNFNSLFQFTSAGNVTWEINEFVYEDSTGSGNSNYSILDLRDLGIESFADLDFTPGADYGVTNDGVTTYANTDVVITAEVNPSWEIVLVGVTEADLAPSENFMFA